MICAPVCPIFVTDRTGAPLPSAALERHVQIELQTLVVAIPDRHATDRHRHVDVLVVPEVGTVDAEATSKAVAELEHVPLRTREAAAEVGIDPLSEQRIVLELLVDVPELPGVRGRDTAELE